MLRIIFCLCLMLSSQLGMTQQFKDYIKAGDKAFQQNNYFEALTRYGDAMEMYDGSIEISYRYAEAARMFDAFTLAERNYETVVLSEEVGNYPLVKFWLGTIKKQLGKYGEAKEMFVQFLDSSPSDNLKVLDARKHVKDCEWAIAVSENNNSNLVLKQLSQEVNTPFSDFAAIERGDTLYYTSDRFEVEDDELAPNRHISKVLTSVAGSQGMKLKNGLNKKRSHTAHTAFNKAANKMYYTVCNYSSNTTIRCDIFVSKRLANGSWASGDKLPMLINAEGATNTQPSVGFDTKTGQETLYFVSDRAGGKGGLDIWSASINQDGTFGKPVNLDVNTEEDDITPFIDNNSQILYFSTKGYPTLGGFDVYKSQLANGSWQTPQHLGMPINGSFNDIYYSQNEDATRAYFSSNRIGSAYIEESKEACCNDIYSVELGKVAIDLLALTFNAEDKVELVGAEVEIQDENGQKIDGKFNPANNKFVFKLEPDKKYTLVATKEGFTQATKDIVVGDGMAQTAYAEQLFLAPLAKEAAKPLALEAFVYDQNRTKLKGATVFLINKANQANQNKRNPANNDFDFELDRETPYYLIAQKDGYKADTLEIDPSSLVAMTSLKKELFLSKEKSVAPPPPPAVSKVTLEGYLPLPLYFDNDQPDSKTRRTSTQKTYIESYQAYYARKNIFKEEYTKGMLGEQKLVGETEIDNFFESDVRAGKETLEAFSLQLLRYLEQGESAEIKIKGFASPRAQSDYNKSLTKRRVSSLRNHFQRWQGGALIQYINNQQLKITEITLGEDAASQGISDNMQDRKSSIYSIDASKERRVEIIEIRN